MVDETVEPKKKSLINNVKILLKIISENSPLLFIKDKYSWLIILFTLLFISSIFHGWALPLETPQITGEYSQKLINEISKGVTNNITVTIVDFIVDVRYTEDSFVDIWLEIKNNGEQTIQSTPLILPWDIERQHHGISNLKLEPDESVTAEVITARYISLSNNAVVEPMKYRSNNNSSYQIGLSVIPLNDKLKYLQGFGTVLDIEWDKPINHSEIRKLRISFNLEGAVYRRSTIPTLTPSPFNYFPLDTSLRFKTFILFPFANEVEIKDLEVRFPKEFVAKPYKVPEFTLTELNQSLKTVSVEGFLMWIMPEDFNPKNSCVEDTSSTIFSCTPDYKICEPVSSGCILKNTYLPKSEELINSSQRYHLKIINAARNPVMLIRWLYDPSSHPSFTESPGILALLVDFDMTIWKFVVPILIVSLIFLLSIAPETEKLNKTTKLLLLIPLIIVLFQQWQELESFAPPVHPNILDFIFILAVYVGVISFLAPKWIFLNILWVSVFSGVLLSYTGLVHSNTLGDFIWKTGLSYSMLGFALIDIPLGVISLLSQAFILKSLPITGHYWIWIIRFLTVIIVLPILFNYLTKKFKLTKIWKQFILSYLIFSGLWFSFIPIFYYYLGNRTFERIVDDVLFLPITISLLILIQQKFLLKPQAEKTKL